MKIETQIKTMLEVMSKGIYEKEHILAMTLLSAIAGESIFCLALQVQPKVWLQDGFKFNI